MWMGMEFHGGFRVTPSLASRVMEAVDEVTRRTFRSDLSHVDGDDCTICREARAKETGHDAADGGGEGRTRAT